MIFISYSWRDAILVQPFVQKLKFIGFKTWVDYQDLDLNMDLGSQLRNGVFASDAVIFIESWNSNASQWVQYERHLASISAKSCFNLPVMTIVSPNRCVELIANDLLNKQNEAS